MTETQKSAEFETFGRAQVDHQRRLAGAFIPGDDIDGPCPDNALPDPFLIQVFLTQYFLYGSYVFHSLSPNKLAFDAKMDIDNERIYGCLKKYIYCLSIPLWYRSVQTPVTPC